MDIIQKITIEIVHDPDPVSPRQEDGNICKMVCWHSRYNLGDEHEFASPEDFRKEINENNALIVPLYLYDHSGITISTAPFSCKWDSGQIGYAYALNEDIENYREYIASKSKGEENKESFTFEKSKELHMKFIEDEVEIYDSYLRGEVYGVLIKNEKDEVIDSCFGFYDKDSVKFYIDENLSSVIDV